MKTFIVYKSEGTDGGKLLFMFQIIKYKSLSFEHTHIYLKKIFLEPYVSPCWSQYSIKNHWNELLDKRLDSHNFNFLFCDREHTSQYFDTEEEAEQHALLEVL